MIDHIFIGDRFTVQTEQQAITFEGPVMATGDAFYLAGCTSGLGSVATGLGAGVGGLAGALVSEAATALLRRDHRQVSSYWQLASNLPTEIRQRMNLRDSTQVFVVPRPEIDELRYWLWWGEMKIITYSTDFRVDVNPLKLFWMRRALRKLAWDI